MFPGDLNYDVVYVVGNAYRYLEGDSRYSSGDILQDLIWEIRHYAHYVAESFKPAQLLRWMHRRLQRAKADIRSQIELLASLLERLEERITRQRWRRFELHFSIAALPG